MTNNDKTGTDTFGPLEAPTSDAYLITDAQLTDLMQAAELLTCASEEPQAQQARELVRGVVQAARKVGR